MGLKEWWKDTKARVQRAWHRDTKNYELPNSTKPSSGSVLGDSMLWIRPVGDAMVDLPDDVIQHIQTAGTCPYCDSPLYTGPSGGMSTNLFCGNRKCDSRFNIAEPPLPWGQFTGRCPEGFYDALEKAE